MSSPNSSTETLGDGIYVTRSSLGDALVVSPELGELLVQSRNAYAWRGSPRESQKRMLALTGDAARAMAALNATTLHQLVARIAKWDSGRTDAAIAGWTTDQREQARAALVELHGGRNVRKWLLELDALPGLDLVLATKIYRFIAPAIGAAGDRHSTYFANSLAVHDDDGPLTEATDFRREWASGSHAASRWAIYGDKEAEADEYAERYLPLLAGIANALNASGRPHTCAARGVAVEWLPADVEMAMAFWWAKHGPR